LRTTIPPDNSCKGNLTRGRCQGTFTS
jgi:hypothetical protein